MATSDTAATIPRNPTESGMLGGGGLLPATGRRLGRSIDGGGTARERHPRGDVAAPGRDPCQGNGGSACRGGE